MKALLTGGTGFIGSHAAEALLAAGVDVYALVRDPGKTRFLPVGGVHLLTGDLESVPALPPDLDWVFHLAGLTKTLKTDDYYSVNQIGTARLFEAIAAQGLRPKIIHVSSLAAAGPSRGAAGRTEDEIPAPVSPYGKSKLAAEAEALARKDLFSLTILRVGSVFGPRDSDFLSFFRILRRGFLPSFGRVPRPLSLCYVKDLVRAMILAARTNTETGTILNIGSPRASNFDEIGRAGARILGRRVRRIVLPLPAVGLAALGAEAWSWMSRKPGAITFQKYRQLKQAGWAADVRKAKAVLGFEAAYSLEKALEETLGWYRDQGWL